MKLVVESLSIEARSPVMALRNYRQYQLNIVRVKERLVIRLEVGFECYTDDVEAMATVAKTIRSAIEALDEDSTPCICQGWRK